MTSCLFVLVLQLASVWAGSADACDGNAGECVDWRLDDATTLLQAKARVDKSAMTLDKGEVLVQSFQDMLQSVKNGKKTVNVSELAIIKDMVEALMPSVADAHAQATSALDESIERVKACVNETEAGLAKASESEESTTELGEDHKTCRLDEKTKASDTTEKCDALDSFLRDATFPTIPSPVTLEALEPVLNEYKRLADVLQDRKNACHNATSTHDHKQSVCNGKQASFEARFCEYSVELTTLKSDSSTCYADAKLSYDEIAGKTPGHVEKFKAQMKAFKKILCYLEVWLQSDTIDAAIAQQCEDTPVDTSDMDITDPGIPSEKLVDDSSVVVFPGTSEWIDRYKDIPHNSEIVYCESHSSTTTVEATTTTTKIAIPGLTDLYTLEGWQVYVFRGNFKDVESANALCAAGKSGGRAVGGYFASVYTNAVPSITGIKVFHGDHDGLGMGCNGHFINCNLPQEFCPDPDTAYDGNVGTKGSTNLPCSYYTIANHRDLIGTESSPGHYSHGRNECFEAGDDGEGGNYWRRLQCGSNFIDKDMLCASPA